MDMDLTPHGSDPIKYIKPTCKKPRNAYKIHKKMATSISSKPFS
jgi:hypothetical protein